MFSGCLVLAGWAFDIPIFTSLRPGFTTMKPNAALAFVLAGAALWLIQSRSPGGRARRLAHLLAGVVALIGAATFAEHAFDADLGIDQLLFHEPAGTGGTTAPGRMSPYTALGFVLAAAALTWLDTLRGFLFAQTSTMMVGFFGLFGVVSHLYIVQPDGVAVHTQMALHTAALLALFSAGALCAFPQRGVLSLLLGRDTVGTIARRLLPAAILVPVVLGWLRLYGQRRGLYDTEYGLVLMVMSAVAILAGLVYWSVTALARAEGALRQLNAELEERVRQRTADLEVANKELESFSYSVSHDLRAPLRGIDGFSHALAEDYADKLDDQGKDYLQRIRVASQRMAELIDDMLKLARVTRAPMQHEPVDLGTLGHSIIAELQRTQPQRPVDVIIEPGLIVAGDPKLLRVLLENLLANAWKFTGKQPHPRIEFGAHHDNGIPVYFVRDNGAGFDMKYAHKLFGAFQRLHTVAEFPGTGVGLATAQRIVHRHGGRAWAEAAEGRGATFFFTLSPEPGRTPA